MEDFKLDILIEPLQDWYVEHARILPWREDPKAYYVWASEIMLQQTRVDTVKPYFMRFVQELPDVYALAECPEERLLKLWEGLGYYNRVRNMKTAAIQMVEHYDGRVPQEYEQLLSLKGIGHYTAGAIASIAYGKPWPAVDGNVLRVLSRVTGDDSDITKASVRESVESRLRQLMLDHEEGGRMPVLYPGSFNQALMELGALVCVPNGAPYCEECPWRFLCQARRQNRISELPVKSKPGPRRIEERTVFVAHKGTDVAIDRRASTGLLAGLYELPNCEGYLSMAEAVAYIKEMGYEPLEIQELPDAKHIFSHVEWRMKGYAVCVAEHTPDEITGTDLTGRRERKGSVKQEVPDKKTGSPEWIFASAADVRERYAIPSAFAAYAGYINKWP